MKAKKSTAQGSKLNIRGYKLVETDYIIVCCGKTNRKGDGEQKSIINEEHGMRTQMLMFDTIM